MPLANKQEDSNLHLDGVVMGEKASVVHMDCTARRMKHDREADSLMDFDMMGVSLKVVEMKFKCTQVSYSS